jgi:hypothetical protein
MTLIDSLLQSASSFRCSIWYFVVGIDNSWFLVWWFLGFGIFVFGSGSSFVHSFLLPFVVRLSSASVVRNTESSAFHFVIRSSLERFFCPAAMYVEKPRKEWPSRKSLVRWANRCQFGSTFSGCEIIMDWESWEASLKSQSDRSQAKDSYVGKSNVLKIAVQDSPTCYSLG